jgi:hypothetical protein
MERANKFFDRFSIEKFVLLVAVGKNCTSGVHTSSSTPGISLVLFDKESTPSVTKSPLCVFLNANYSPQIPMGFLPSPRTTNCTFAHLLITPFFSCYFFLQVCNSIRGRKVQLALRLFFN